MLCNCKLFILYLNRINEPVVNLLPAVPISIYLYIYFHNKQSPTYPHSVTTMYKDIMHSLWKLYWYKLIFNRYLYWLRCPWCTYCFIYSILLSFYVCSFVEHHNQLESIIITDYTVIDFRQSGCLSLSFLIQLPSHSSSVLPKTASNLQLAHQSQQSFQHPARDGGDQSDPYYRLWERPAPLPAAGAGQWESGQSQQCCRGECSHMLIILLFIYRCISIN